MTGGNPRTLLRWLTFAAGTAAVAVALFVDRIGLGKPGFGERQVVLLLIGVFLVLGATSFLSSGRIRTGNDGRPDPGDRWPRLRRFHVAAAVLLLNTIFFFAAFDLALLVGFQITDGVGLTTPESAGGLVDVLAVLRLARLLSGTAAAGDVWPLDLDDEELALICPDWSRAEIRSLLTESRGRPLSYEPFSQFGEGAHSGRYVNVSKVGYRRSLRQGPWPMDDSAWNIWVFGGSTTFGYGLPDEQTIPSLLQAALAGRTDRLVHVYNFGQAYYYSSQELALFYRLLATGPVQPETMVFIDGINESASEPFYSDALRRLMRSPYTAPYVRTNPPAPLNGDETVERYLRNKRLIEDWCLDRGIHPLFVWQPSPEWKYDLRFHLLDPRRAEANAPILGSSPHYAALEQRIAAGRLGLDSRFLFLADMQIGVEEPLYLDLLHYTASFSRKIAQRIADRLLAHGRSDESPPLSGSDSPTGQ